MLMLTHSLAPVRYQPDTTRISMVRLGLLFRLPRLFAPECLFLAKVSS